MNECKLVCQGHKETDSSRSKSQGMTGNTPLKLLTLPGIERSPSPAPPIFLAPHISSCPWSPAPSPPLTLPTELLPVLQTATLLYPLDFMLPPPPCFHSLRPLVHPPSPAHLPSLASDVSNLPGTRGRAGCAPCSGPRRWRPVLLARITLRGNDLFAGSSPLLDSEPVLTFTGAPV